MAGSFLSGRTWNFPKHPDDESESSRITLLSKKPAWRSLVYNPLNCINHHREPPWRWKQVVPVILLNPSSSWKICSFRAPCKSFSWWKSAYYWGDRVDFSVCYLSELWSSGQRQSLVQLSICFCYFGYFFPLNLGKDQLLYSRSHRAPLICMTSIYRVEHGKAHWLW